MPAPEMFSDDDVERAWSAAAGMEMGSYASTRAIMSVAAELLAARAGTMTAELDPWVRMVEVQLHRPTSAAVFREHCAAMGARIAALEKELRKTRIALGEATIAKGDSERRLQQLRDGIEAIVSRCADMARVAGEPRPKENVLPVVRAETMLQAFAAHMGVPFDQAWLQDWLASPSVVGDGEAP